MTDQELRRLAEAATPGPWKWTAKQRVSEMNTGRSVADLRYRNGDADAAYIAAISPDVLLGLLREKEALRTALERAVWGISDDGSLLGRCRQCGYVRPDHSPTCPFTEFAALLAGERRDG